jgi:hypothetical protein
MELSLNILCNGRMNRPHKYLFTILESSEIDECQKLTLTNTGVDIPKHEACTLEHYVV